MSDKKGVIFDVRKIGKGRDQLMPLFRPKEAVEKRGEEIEHFWSELFKRGFLPQVRAFPKVRALFERILTDDYKIALASSARGVRSWRESKTCWRPSTTRD